MAKYAVLFPVSARVESHFTKEEIELAAKIAFFQHPAPGNLVPVQEVELNWTTGWREEDAKLIHVSGVVIPPEETNEVTGVV